MDQYWSTLVSSSLLSNFSLLRSVLNQVPQRQVHLHEHGFEKFKKKILAGLHGAKQAQYAQFGFLKILSPVCAKVPTCYLREHQVVMK